MLPVLLILAVLLFFLIPRNTEDEYEDEIIFLWDKEDEEISD